MVAALIFGYLASVFVALGFFEEDFGDAAFPACVFWPIVLLFFIGVWLRDRIKN